jgi:hypothetical protein
MGRLNFYKDKGTGKNATLLSGTFDFLTSTWALVVMHLPTPGTFTVPQRMPQNTELPTPSPLMQS